MPDKGPLHCSLITPDRKVLECEARFVAIPAHDGEIGFLQKRAPLVCKLGVGELRIDSPDGLRRYLIDGGFAEMLANNLTILTTLAEAAEGINSAEADQAMQAAQELPGPDLASRAAKDLALARARARQRIAKATRIPR